MRVLQLSTTDGAGGAGRAARRLHEALPSVGVSSRLVAAHVDFPAGEVESVAGAAVGSSAAWLLAPEKAPPKLMGLTGQVNVPLPSSHLLARSNSVEWADVVHLHNLHGNWFDLRALRTLARRRPLVWTLHDMWPMSGHCAYSFDCERWRTGCGPCPLFNADRRPLDDIPQPPWDNSGPGWRFKRRLYEELEQLTITAPSRWLIDLARESILAVAPGSSFRQIPHGIDTDTYKPTPRSKARRALGLAPNRAVVLFGAASLAQERKGLRHLAAALRLPPLAGRNLTLLAFGRVKGLAAELPGLQSLGEIFDERRQSLAYNAADLAVVPSLADNQPLVALEALACGTPVVASAVGGLTELVSHAETGLNVPPGDETSLSKAIAELLDDHELHARLSAQARRQIVERHGLRTQAEAFRELYSDCVFPTR
jgi:glycosyltransferase involved in cell wall biosynthesis